MDKKYIDNTMNMALWKGPEVCGRVSVCESLWNVEGSFSESIGNET